MFKHLNPKKLEPFKQAYQMKLDHEDYVAWLHGAYIQKAVGSCLDGKHCKYPSQPESVNNTVNQGLSGEEQFLLWVDSYNRKYEV